MKTSIADRIKRLRKDLGLNQTEFAARLGGGDQSLISKWERGEQLPNAEHSARLASMAGLTIGQWHGIRPLEESEVTGRKYRVVGEVRAGAWREAIEWDYDDQYDVPVPPLPGVPNIPMTGYVVGGPSMNRIYPDGTIVFVAATVANGIKPKSGQRVLVQRRNTNGMYEATLKELVIDENGKKWLWPRSYDPEHQAPLALKSNDAEEITITGVVMAAFMTEAIRT